jgi:hypothetical protein
MFDDVIYQPNYRIYQQSLPTKDSSLYRPASFSRFYTTLGLGLQQLGMSDPHCLLTETSFSFLKPGPYRKAY